MPSLPVFLSLAYVLLSTVAAAETRTFVIANSSDGYGVDQCLASGASCGKMIANSYCQSQDYVEAAAFRKVERAEVTGSTPVSTQAGRGLEAATFVAIECTR